MHRSNRGRRGRWRLLGPLIAALVALVPRAEAADVVFTLGAISGSITPLLGVNAGPLAWAPGTVDATLGFQQIGVRQVRGHDMPVELDMSTIYPDRSKNPDLQSSYNFASSRSGVTAGADNSVAAIVDKGFGLYLRIWDSAGNMAAPSMAQRPNWVKAAVNLVRHYQEGLWNGRSGLVQQVEIGNEPDSRNFWPSPYSDSEFAQLYVDTAKALRAAFPTLKIGGPGYTSESYQLSSGQSRTRSFLQTVKNQGAPLDFFSWHTYTNTPADYGNGARFFRGELDKLGFTQTEQHVTEYNTSVNTSTASSDALALRTQARGAAINTAGWITLQENAVAQAFFYRANDPSATDTQRYGLFDTAGMPRKVALAFALWSELASHTSRVTVNAPAAAGNLKALAGTRSDGQIAVLLANTGATAARWSVAFADGRKLADFAATVRSVDDSSPLATTAAVGSDGSIEVPAYGVQLLTLHARTQAFSAWVTRFGSTAGQIASVTLRPAAADIGKTQSVVLAVRVGSTLFLHDGHAWQPWTQGEFPVYWKNPLPAELCLPLFTSAIDLRGYEGSVLYLGYGSSASEMLAAGRYQLLWTLAP